MRYKITENQDLEAYDIIDMESWTSSYEDRDNIVVMSVYDGTLVAAIAEILERMDFPRTIGK